MKSEGVHDLGEANKPVRGVSTNCGGAQRRFYLWVPSEPKPSPSLLRDAGRWQPTFSALPSTGRPSLPDPVLA